MVFVAYCEKVADYVKRGSDKVSCVINWLPWSEALKIAKQEGKPIIILVQDPDCEGCNAFKEEFSASAKAQELSSNFILASVKRSDAPKDLKQDGDYVPRIYFAASDGKILPVYNELGNPKRKFNYPNIRSLLVSMNNVIKSKNQKK